MTPAPPSSCRIPALRSAPMSDLPAHHPGPLAPADPVPVQPQRLRALDDLVRGFLLSKRSVKTRQAYAADLASWLTFCAGLHVDPLTAGMHHADAYLRLLDEVGDPRTGHTMAPASITRRTSAVHGFYRYATRQRAVEASPFTEVQRPRVGDEHATSALSATEARHLLHAA